MGCTPNKEKDSTQEQKRKEVSRVESKDTVTIELSSKIREAKGFIKRLEIKAKESHISATKALKEKNKTKALLALKLKKMYTKQIENANNMIAMLEKTKVDLESSALTEQVYNTLKDGTITMKELQAKVSIADLEDLRDESEEIMRLNNEVTEFFKGKTNDEQNVLKELDEIEEQTIKQEMDDPSLKIPIHEVPHVNEGDKVASPSHEIISA